MRLRQPTCHTAPRGGLRGRRCSGRGSGFPGALAPRPGHPRAAPAGLLCHSIDQLLMREQGKSPSSSSVTMRRL